MPDPVRTDPPLDELFSAAYEELRRLASLVKSDDPRATLSPETLSPDHLNTGIARLKLGRTLLREKRYAEAEPELLAGHTIVSGQTTPAVSWLRAAREDLVSLCEATGRPDQAAKFRANPVAPGASNPAR